MIRQITETGHLLLQAGRSSVSVDFDFNVAWAAVVFLPDLGSPDLVPSCNPLVPDFLSYNLIRHSHNFCELDIEWNVSGLRRIQWTIGREINIDI